MEILKTNELIATNGGAISFGLAITIVGVVVMIIGIIDGYLRPLKCRK